MEQLDSFPPLHEDTLPTQSADGATRCRKRPAGRSSDGGQSDIDKATNTRHSMKKGQRPPLHMVLDTGDDSKYSAKRSRRYGRQGKKRDHTQRQESTSESGDDSKDSAKRVRRCTLCNGSSKLGAGKCIMRPYSICTSSIRTSLPESLQTIGGHFSLCHRKPRPISLKNHGLGAGTCERDR